MKFRIICLALVIIHCFQSQAQSTDSTQESGRWFGMGVTYMDHFGIGFTSLYKLSDYSQVEGAIGIPEPYDGTDWKFNFSLLTYSHNHKNLCFGIGYQFRKYISPLTNGTRITKTSSILFQLGYAINIGRLQILPKIGLGPFVDRFTYDKDVDPKQDPHSGTISFSQEHLDVDLGVRFNYLF